ncbi:iron-sulfur cluster biosynthesis family protein [Peribacillus sp. B-H-3]|jgi:iron-sulfur cluster insertion protein|uniref:iron-sulfur cluster biosynthesis family protein n=1 Tax=Peribacillus sp. B-H-3 TaxID=3400420 RepID=UPI003B017F6F
MKIEWTEAAMKKIQEKLNGTKGLLKLKYDTDGCGCVVSGVTALWLVDEIDEEDLRVETRMGDIYLERSKVIFLDESMKVDFSPEANSFMLKTSNEILNPRLGFYNRTAGK